MQLNSWDTAVNRTTRELALEKVLRVGFNQYAYDHSVRSTEFRTQFLDVILRGDFGLLEGETGRFTDTYGRRLLLIRTCVGNVVFLECEKPENRENFRDLMIVCYRPQELEGILNEGKVTQSDLFRYAGTFNGRSLGKTLAALRGAFVSSPERVEDASVSRSA